MENLTYYILGLYVLPMVFNLLFVYSDKQINTLGELLEKWWGYFVPLLNLLVTIAIPIYYISVYFESSKVFEKIKNIKIK
jgi:hypothetical protein